MHPQPEQCALQRIHVRAAERMPLRARPQTPHPSVSVKPGNAIRHALFHCDWSGELRPYQTRIFAVNPVPPVEETKRMRRNLACTPVTVRASPVVAVVVSMV